MVSFTLLHTDALSQARLGQLQTHHGAVATPAFMPVGTQGSVKGIEVGQLAATGTQMILANTYHLTVRPGESVVATLGGLHRFTGWTGPILTDSGGFQIFSLAQQVTIDEQGAVFRSHVDGREIQLTPERAVEIQESLGSDVAMVLDHVIPLPSSGPHVEDACARSIRWARRCKDAHQRSDQGLFAIVQGGLDPRMRKSCAAELVSMGFDGYAVGGLSVGETHEQMEEVLKATCPALPRDRPRYLMGVGRPADLLTGIRHGIDLFDCVMPTRNGRNAMAFTDHGTLHLRNQVHTLDHRPIEEGCPCIACQRSRGYLRHLFHAGEMLGPVLVSIHNLTYYQRLMQRAREAIRHNGFIEFHAQCLSNWT